MLLKIVKVDPNQAKVVTDSPVNFNTFVPLEGYRTRDIEVIHKDQGLKVSIIKGPMRFALSLLPGYEFPDWVYAYRPTSEGLSLILQVPDSAKIVYPKFYKQSEVIYEYNIGYSEVNEATGEVSTVVDNMKKRHAVRDKKRNGQ